MRLPRLLFDAAHVNVNTVVAERVRDAVRPRQGRLRCASGSEAAAAAYARLLRLGRYEANIVVEPHPLRGAILGGDATAGVAAVRLSKQRRFTNEPPRT